MEAKFTPGPWHLVQSNNATPFIQHEMGDDWTDIDDRSSRVCVMPVEILEDHNALNNARLIAAAPDLYEALDRVHKLISQFSESGFNPLTEPEIAEELFLSQGQRFDALKKARGEQL